MTTDRPNDLFSPTRMSMHTNDETTTATTPVLSIRGLSKTYETASGPRLVLDHVDLDVPAGQFTCIVGPSGAGKTTLLRCMSGLLQPTSGEIRLAGELVHRPPSRLAVVMCGVPGLQSLTDAVDVRHEECRASAAIERYEQARTRNPSS
ncbi:ATP-binding cassette domain-containing protein [Rhodococcus sp. 27YEA15]|uniref:ATP-binding cassette domain-containing protein n=1 Tax=Rhodococcus sp. 27YEA15 TaxID=3156259 RepID=UPI003C7B2186